MSRTWQARCTALRVGWSVMEDVERAEDAAEALASSMSSELEEDVLREDGDLVTVDVMSPEGELSTWDVEAVHHVAFVARHPQGRGVH